MNSYRRILAHTDTLLRSHDRLELARALAREHDASVIDTRSTDAAEVARQALHADLVVLGQPDPEQPGPAPRDLVESVLEASGKPALVVPYVGPLPERFATVAIAWKTTRESALAVAGALPILQRAKRVVILTWGEPSGEQDLRNYLMAHGVEADSQGSSEEPTQIGELILSRAFDISADLLVMGCYGHSRAREYVLGGASRTVLRSMTLPLLLAH